MSSDLNNNSLEVMMVQLNKAERQITKSSQMIT